MSAIIRRSVSLEEEDMQLISQLADRKGLGSRGFSAALRMIIREWVGFSENDRVRITQAGQAALGESRQSTSSIE